MSFSLHQVERLAHQAARLRAKLWAVTIELSDNTRIVVSKSPTQVTRTANEHGAGYVQRAIAVFLIPQGYPTRPVVGAEWEIVDSKLPADIGTSWRVFEVTSSPVGAEDRFVCFRMD